MQVPDVEGLPPPPGVIGSLKAGFDTIALNLTAILLPLGLDLLLWLGPRLSVKDYYRNVLMPLMQEMSGVSAAQSAIQSSEAQAELVDSINLLTNLHTFPIGISSLLSRPLTRVAPLTPFGEPRTFQVDSLEGILGIFLLLTLIGWLGGALYFRSVAALVVPQGSAVQMSAVMQSLMLSMLAAAVMIIVGLPLMGIIYALNIISPAIGQGVLLFLGFMSMWLVVPLFFAGHGVFMRSQTALASVLSGVRMARFSLPNSSLFVLSVLFISIGLNYLWIIPGPESWMLVVGIVGHAFITTALLAASFIYYRDTTAWLQTIFERLQAGASSTKA